MNACRCPANPPTPCSLCRQQHGHPCQPAPLATHCANDVRGTVGHLLRPHSDSGSVHTGEPTARGLRGDASVPGTPTEHELGSSGFTVPRSLSAAPRGSRRVLVLVDSYPYPRNHEQTA